MTRLRIAHEMPFLEAARLAKPVEPPAENDYAAARIAAAFTLPST